MSMLASLHFFSLPTHGYVPNRSYHSFYVPSIQRHKLSCWYASHVGSRPLCTKQHTRFWGHRIPLNKSVEAKALHTCFSSVAIDPTLYDYVISGPILDACGLSNERVEEMWDQWLDLADTIIANLGFPPRDQLDNVQRMRVFQYYLPVFYWCWQQLEDHRRTGSRRPLVIGMQAVQGCGKTTLVEELQTLFAKVGCNAASVSIDDFYLTFQDQQALIKSNPDNFLLGVRGNAGTHDLALGRETLEALLALGASDGEIQVPRYDKSAYQGRGDRAPKEAWPTVKGPVDVVLFEGWMLGFSPIPEDAAREVSPDLVPINQQLSRYVSEWDSKVDAWLVVQVDSPEYVFRWRLQAEHAMKAAGKPGMTDEQVKDFVDRYMPAYRAYLPNMYAKGPSTGKEGRLLKFVIDESRGLLDSMPPN